MDVWWLGLQAFWENQHNDDRKLGPELCYQIKEGQSLSQDRREAQLCSSACLQEGMLWLWGAVPASRGWSECESSLCRNTWERHTDFPSLVSLPPLECG